MTNIIWIEAFFRLVDYLSFWFSCFIYLFFGPAKILLITQGYIEQRKEGKEHLQHDIDT